jgi:hypothetical protein
MYVPGSSRSKVGDSSEDAEGVGKHDEVVVVHLPVRLRAPGQSDVGFRRAGKWPSNVFACLGLRATWEADFTADAGVFGLSRRRRQAEEKLVDVLDVDDACSPTLYSLGQPAAATSPRPNSGGQVRAERESYASSDDQRARPVSALAPDDPAQTGGDDYEADLRQSGQNSFVPDSSQRSAASPKNRR